MTILLCSTIFLVLVGISMILVFISKIPGSHRGFRSDHFGFDEDELHTLQRQGSKQNILLQSSC